MEELLLALLLWLGQGLVRLFRWARDRLLGRSEVPERPSDAMPRPSDAQVDAQRAGGSTPVPPRGAKAPGDLLADRLTALESRLSSVLLEVGADRATSWVADTLEEPLRGRIRRARASGLPQSAEERAAAGSTAAPPAAGAPEAQPAWSDLRWLEGTTENLAQLARERSGPQARALETADRLCDALLAALPAGGDPSGAGRAPAGRAVVRPAMTRSPDPGLARLGVLEIPVSPALDADALAWLSCAQGVGRALLAARPALRQELHARLGLPHRYGVPYLFEGFWTEEMVYAPFGPWLETLFADATAICLLGPAAAHALAKTLGTSRPAAGATTVQLARNGTEYAATPPSDLRVVGAAAVLQSLGFAEEADALLRAWRQGRGGPTALLVPTRVQGWIPAPTQAFVERAVDIAAALATTPWAHLGGRPLVAAAPPPEALAEARALAERLARAPETRPEAEVPARLRLLAALVAAQTAPEARAALGTWLGAHGAPPAPRAAAPKTTGGRAHRAARISDPGRAALLRDALLLHEILSPPRALRARGPGLAPPP